MTVDGTVLLKALKKEQGDISDFEKDSVAEDVHDFVTRRMGCEDPGNGETP